MKNNLIGYKFISMVGSIDILLVYYMLAILTKQDKYI